MTTFLFSFLKMTAGAERMMDTDPHGWILTMIAVLTVFFALIILFFIYTFSGNLFQGKYKRQPRAPKPAKAVKEGSEDEIAAAIAMALEAEFSGETEAAIATALHLYLSNAVHDVEPGIITIRRKASAWNDKHLNFIKSPR